MTLEDIKLDTLQPQQGNKGMFRMSALDIGDYGDWVYTFKNEDGSFFKMAVAPLGNRKIIKNK